MGFPFKACVGAASLCLSAQLAAQAIYTCVDAAGRRLTSDRPILECLDREQRVLNPSGSVRGTLAPSYTASERAAIEKKAREEAEARNRLLEQRQRQRALLTRYPSPEVLERERSVALATLDDVIGTATERSAQLIADRRKLESEVAFYAKEPARMPVALKRSLEENGRQLKAQERFIADQLEEKQRIQLRFDEMQRELDVLWQQPSSARAD